MSNVESMGTREDRDEREAALKEKRPRRRHRVQSLATDIEDFHLKFELHYNGPPRELDPEIGLFRIGFMMEELAEYAISAGYTKIAQQLNDLSNHIRLGNRWLTTQNEGGRSLEGQFDAMIDLAYVALGTSYLHGFDFDKGWEAVHSANMKKVRTARIEDSKRGSKFDVVKPKGWEPPDLSQFVAPDYWEE